VNGTNDATGPFTVTVPNALIVVMTAAGDNNIITTGGNISGFPELQRDDAIVTGNTGNGSDCGLGVVHTQMIVPGSVTSARGGSTTSGSVTIAVALIPETASTAGTRYYPTKHNIRTRIEDLAAGDWDMLHNAGLAADAFRPQSFMMSQVKSGGGEATNNGFSTNQTGQDIILCRFFSPPLEAQTISGTFNLCFKVNSRHETTLGDVAGGDIRYKVHIFITNGQTGQVRHVLADNVVDTTPWTTSTSAAWTQLTAPINLTSGACLEGDSVCIEFGASIVSISTPLPTATPIDWNYSNVLGFGVVHDQSWIALPDAPTSGTTADRVAYFDFSHSFVEQSLPASPSNISAGTAVEITSWPYISPELNTSTANSACRQIWYKFTAPETNRCFITSLGSTYDTVIWVFDEADIGNPIFGNQSNGLVTAGAGGVDFSRCDRLVILDAQQGNTYYIRVHTGTLTTSQGGAGQSSGGLFRLTMSWYSAPAEDDLYVPAANIYRLRDGVIVDATPEERFAATTGIALDYSGAVMADFNNPSYPTPTHTNHRLLIAEHDFNSVQIYDAITLQRNSSVVGSITSALEGTGAVGVQLFQSTLSMRGSTLHVAAWGNGYTLVNGSVQLQDSTYYNHPADPASSAYMRTLTDLPALVLDEQGAQVLRGTPHPVPAGPLDPWHIEVATDNRTLYYVSGGWYRDESQIGGVLTSHRTNTIKRFDLNTDLALSDFTSLPLASGVREGLYGLALNPNGQVLVCNGPTVNRISSGGFLLQTYTFPSAKSRALVDVVYTSDAEAFWAYDQSTATLFKVDIETGAILQTVDTYFWSRVTTQIVIYQPNGIESIPEVVGEPGCPADDFPIGTNTARTGCTGAFQIE
jgi:hypothetical protein